MIEKLREEISVLRDLLKERNNKASIFFDSILEYLNQNMINEAISRVLSSYSLVQYADFNNKEELLFDKIWSIANQTRNENLE